MASIFKITFAREKGSPPYATRHAHQPLCQLTHGRVLADEQVRVKEVVGEEGQSVHLAWKSEDNSVSQGPYAIASAGRHRVGAAEGTELASSAMATFPGPQRVTVLLLGKWGIMPVGRSYGERGHQPYMANESWDMMKHKIHTGFQRLYMKTWV